MDVSPTTLAVGLFFVVAAIAVFRAPRIQGARDVDLITSEEAGDAERWGAYAGGLVLLVIGLGFVFLAF